MQSVRCEGELHLEHVLSLALKYFEEMPVRYLKEKSEVNKIDGFHGFSCTAFFCLFSDIVLGH